ncbi:conserved hypothetical protein [Ixodes scapularis]|uniref:TIR domain-containing protein n=1 Tax=Ixodes scapularis TaxID=6945 RepID=B7PJX1_IXOSC|nr:conserved hypothetical protein [Ixodes scapularis]|eukprot:XP_002408807.1 conserved hypothetical protein [Ixodes scapularis]
MLRMARSIDPASDNITTELIPSRKCNHTVTPDGHVTFLCKVLLQTSPPKWFIPAEPQILTMDELFVTDEPLIGTRSGDELACISLHRVRFIKWRDFPPSMYKFYDEHGPFEIHEFLMFLRSLETEIVFQQPVQMGAVNCTSVGEEGQYNCEVFGFNDMVYYNKILNDLELNENYGLTVIVEIMRTWKLSYTHVEQLNVTFIETVESIPSVILEAISFAKIRRIVFHQCNFKSIGFNELPHMRYLKELDFYEVPIGTIDPFAFDMLPDLLDDVMFNDLSGIQEVSVCKNPWDCSSCYLKHLQDFLAQSRRHCCNDCAVCEHPEALANVSVSLAPWNADQCKPPDYYVLVGLPLVLCALVLSVVSHAVYANRWYVRYLLLYLTVKMRGYKRIRHDAHYLWDAFLSYHSSEAEWVRNVLLPGLETSSTGLSICVAERDFIAGVPITENICNSIAHSRKSVFLLSREFCQSRWCMFEVSLAQHRLFEAERENHIVFLKKGQIPEDEMSPVLNFLVKSRTYIAVPDEGANQKIRDMFWLQLQAALQH